MRFVRGCLMSRCSALEQAESAQSAESVLRQLARVLASTAGDDESVFECPELSNDAKDTFRAVATAAFWPYVSPLGGQLDWTGLQFEGATREQVVDAFTLLVLDQWQEPIGGVVIYGYGYNTIHIDT